MKTRISNKFYDILKILALLVLPGLASLYFGISGIWGLPYSEQVVGTILAVAAFLGTILGLSVIKYNKAQTKKKIKKYVQKPMTDFVQAKLSTYSPVLSGKLYSVLYWVAQIVMPAIGTLYFAIASIWGLPYAEQVVGTIALLDAFLGVFLGVNTAQYAKYKALNS